MSELPRLAIVSWYGIEPADAGERIRLEGVTRTLSERFDCHWILLDPDSETWPGADIQVAPRGVGVPYSMPRVAYLTSTARGRGIESTFPGSPALRRWVASALDTVEPDAILANQPFAYGALPQDYRSLAFVDTHNVNSARFDRIAAGYAWYRPEHLLFKAQSALTRRFEREYTSGSRQTWVVSEVDRASLEDAARVHVLPNGADLDESARRRRLESGEVPELLFLGSLGYSANLDALSRLVTWVDASEVEVDVKVVGSGDATAARALVEGREDFDFVGRVDDAREAMRTAHALIAPHFQGGGSRIKILEAMASRTPVLATAVAAEGLGAVGGRDYLALTGPQDLTRAVEQLRDDARMDQITDNAWEIALRSQWSALSRQAGDLIEGVLESAQ